MKCPFTNLLGEKRTVFVAGSRCSFLRGQGRGGYGSDCHGFDHRHRRHHPRCAADELGPRRGYAVRLVYGVQCGAVLTAIRLVRRVL